MNQPSDYIAVFDSGVGGISVLRRLMAQMPQERYLYYGDSANAPYGDRTEAEILALTLSAVETILTHPVKALVVACNTATAVAVDTLRERYPQLTVIGIEPAVKPAADRFPGGTICLLGTTATVRSQRVHRLLERYAGSCRILPLAVPELVPLVEQGLGNSPQAIAALERHLLPYRDTLDAVVLGCTHYPFAGEAIRACLKPETVLLDGSLGTAAHAHRLLAQKGLLWNGPGELVWEINSPDPKLPALCQALMTHPLTL